MPEFSNIDAHLSDEDAARVRLMQRNAEWQLSLHPRDTLSLGVMFLIEKLDRALGDAEAASYHE